MGAFVVIYLRYNTIVCFLTFMRMATRMAATGRKHTVFATEDPVLNLCAFLDFVITVIPRLTKIIRSGITFVSRNVISPKFLYKIV